MANAGDVPNMTPLRLRSSAVSQDLHGWDVWEGHADAAYLRFSGAASSRLDLMNIKWRVHEACRITRCQRLLVDFRDLELPPDGLDISVIRQKIRGKQLRIAVKDADSLSLLRNALDGEVSHDFTSLAASVIGVSPDQVGPAFSIMEAIELAISPISISFAIWPSSSSQSNNGFISASGYYRRGSDGKPDGMWVRWHVDEFCEYVQPHSLLIDLNDLDYEWGDDLFVHPTDEISGRVRIVVPESRLTAFRGVLGEHDLRTDLASALAELSSL